MGRNTRRTVSGAAVGLCALLATGTGNSESINRTVTDASVDLSAPWKEHRVGLAHAMDSGEMRSGVAQLPNEYVNDIVGQYCVVCHNDSMRRGNLSLEEFDGSEAAANAAVAEKMIRKLHAGMMPPPGMPRPVGDSLLAVAEALERTIDEAAEAIPSPGTRAFQRLNQAEYSHAINDLLGLDVDAGRWLPSDTYLANFDNMADAQALSPTLLDAYLNAASEISWLGVGNPEALPLPSRYESSIYVSQIDQVEGAPYGTRGGIVATHDFPADGEYVFEMTFRTRRQTRFEDVDISIDGESVAFLGVEGGAAIVTGPILVRAGQHRVAAAFVQKAHGPFDDLIRPHDWSLAGGGGPSYGTSFPAHMRSLTITGPYNPTGVSETRSRRAIFSCYPASPIQERSCAASIVSRLGGRAYRRPLADSDLEVLMSFYERGAADGGFENGIRLSLQAMLASPHFIFRVERQPAGTRGGEAFALSDFDLASRLSFFLWGSPPDEELLAVASDGRLSQPDVLEQQTRRMLADLRSEALATRFAAQWLRLQDMYKVRPDAFWFPNFDENTMDDMRRETELFFHNLVREDRSVLELFTADYTFLNERLARHYGIRDVVGSQFRRVQYSDARRHGLLGHGSVLLLTSMGSRTSPVLRGKWVMEVLLGSPPPPPPPDVPDLEATQAVTSGRLLTTRERLELHRANPTCYACHQYMDPIGLALDNFDVTGRWRIRENGAALDTRGDFYDGTPVSTPAELTAVLLKRPIPLLRTFTENLLAYAVGRPVEYFDMPVVREIARKAESNDNRMSSFILGIVTSDPFRMKQAESSAASTGSRDAQ